MYTYIYLYIYTYTYKYIHIRVCMYISCDAGPVSQVGRLALCGSRSAPPEALTPLSISDKTRGRGGELLSLVDIHVCIHRRFFGSRRRAPLDTSRCVGGSRRRDPTAVLRAGHSHARRYRHIFITHMHVQVRRLALCGSRSAPPEALAALGAALETNRHLEHLALGSNFISQVGCLYVYTFIYMGVCIYVYIYV